MKKIIIILFLLMIQYFVKTANADLLPTTWTTSETEQNSSGGRAIATDSLGNIYVTGYIYGINGGLNYDDVWLGKYDANGKRIWEQTYNGTTSYFDKGNGITVDSLGNIYVIGYTENKTPNRYDLWARKYDTNGNVLTTTTSVSAVGYNICTDNANNIYAVGIGPNGGAFIVKFNTTNLTVVWSTAAGSLTNVSVPAYFGDNLMGITVDAAGTYIYVTAGSKGGVGFQSNIWVGKYSTTNGSEIWSKTIGTDNKSYGQSIVLDGNGYLYLSGLTGLWTGSTSLWLGKYSIADGSEIWRKNKSTVSGKGIAMFNGELFVTGAMSSYLWLAKYDTNGNQLTEQNHTYSGSFISDSGYGISADSSGNILVTGDVKSHVFVAKYGSIAIVTPPQITGYLKIVGGKDGYVNPNRSETSNFIYKTTAEGTVTFKIFNSRGNLCRTVSANASGPSQYDSFIFDCRNDSGEILASGIYTVKAEGPGMDLVKKIAILK